jgi:hypothetical protein
MAVTSDSDDENMADNEFDDFMVSNNNLFIYEDEDNEESKVPDLATRLKKLLKISDTAKNPIPPSDNPINILNTRDLTDSSDDEQGAVAMQISSESDSKVEIDPYWLKITVNELQGLGNPVEALHLDVDSMPDLEDVSESDILKDSVIFILTLQTLSAQPIPRRIALRIALNQSVMGR